MYFLEFQDVFAQHIIGQMAGCFVATCAMGNLLGHVMANIFMGFYKQKLFSTACQPIFCVVCR